MISLHHPKLAQIYSEYMMGHITITEYQDACAYTLASLERLEKEDDER